MYSSSVCLEGYFSNIMQLQRFNVLTTSCVCPVEIAVTMNKLMENYVRLHLIFCIITLFRLCNCFCTMVSRNHPKTWAYKSGSKKSGVFILTRVVFLLVLIPDQTCTLKCSGKAKRQYLLTLQVSRYRLLVLQSSLGQILIRISQLTIFYTFIPSKHEALTQCHLNVWPAS